MSDSDGDDLQRGRRSRRTHLPRTIQLSAADGSALGPEPINVPTYLHSLGFSARQIPRTKSHSTEYEGPYVGLGPRQSRRSDDQISNDICNRLSRHGQIDAREIDIQVQQANVTLLGSVKTRREQRLAEEQARQVAGVHSVQNELRIRRGQQGDERIYGA